MIHEFSTTHVGSLLRPEYLLNAFSEYSAGKLPREDFEKILETAVRSVVKAQVKTAIDEVNDGEYNRLIFFGGLTSLPGFAPNMFPLEFSASDVYRQPMVTGKIEYNARNPAIALEVGKVKDALKELNSQKRVKVTFQAHLS